MPAGLPDVASGVVDTAIGYLFTEGYVLSGWSVQRLLTKARYSQGDVIIQLLSEFVFFFLLPGATCVATDRTATAVLAGSKPRAVEPAQNVSL